jgi:hypothetical protein
MALDIFTSEDLHQNQIKELVIDNLAIAPATPVVGQEYFDTTLGYGRVWNGVSWDAMSPAGSKYATTIGNGILLSFVVTHNLNTRDVVVSTFDNTTFNEVVAAVQHTTANTITVTFSLPPLLNQYRVVVES